LKVAEEALAGTVTEVGEVNKRARLLESVTTEPPAGAALDRVTVQEELAFTPRMFAVQLSAARVGGELVRLAEPPVAERGRASPAREALTGLTTPIAAVVAPDASTTETVATTPLGMVSVVIPVARQV
jgi:ligand-binding SRPBCC domain-containing protein